MTAETRTCQNCKQSFVIEPDDFAFYERMNIPPPTFCFYCRLHRRMAFRNERTLYRRKCDAPGHNEEVISVFSPDNPQTVYDHQAWWGDAWDGISFGREYDFKISFFSQLQNLWQEVPDIALLNINPVNSEYCSVTEGNKNCYLVVGGDFNENTNYAAFIFNSKECCDCYWDTKCEWNYETVDCINCSKLLYSRYCEGSYSSAFLLNCKNCHDCFGCVNLSNKSYCIFNEQYSKEEYEKKIKEYNLGSRESIANLKKQFTAHAQKYPKKFARVLRAVNSIGDNLEETKNCSMVFDVFGGAEDCRYLWLAYSNVKDCFDCDHFGLKSELAHEISTIYPGNNSMFSRFLFNCHDVQYSYNCHNSSYLFGCVGLRNKQYCIFNKQYSKEEYEKLIPRIIKHMDEMPYADRGGRIYKYGEFFPAEISPFAYNETVAQELAPLSFSQAAQRGIKWKEVVEKKYSPTIMGGDLSDSISDVKDSILQEVISCGHNGQCNHQCSTAFKIIPAELEFYRHLNVPLPDICPNCRHYERLAQRNPLKLWHRSCQCEGGHSAKNLYSNASHHFHGNVRCPNEFETSYAPDRPELVYCEQCYQAEIL